jgi:PAS domain S-box-containing protein
VNALEVSALERLRDAIALMVQGSLCDARDAIVAIDLPGHSLVRSVIASMVQLTDRLIVELESKESALAYVQTAMWELESTKEDLRANEARFRTTLASVGDGLISTDTAGRVEFMNAVAEKLTGWTADDARLHPISEVFHIFDGQSRTLRENLVERVLREGKVISLVDHTLLVARDGAERQIADSCAPIRSPDGQLLGAVLVFRDVTEEQVLAVELSHARKLEAVGQLAAGIAHEINTPAQFVGDSIHFLADGYSDMQRLMVEYRSALAALASAPGCETVARQLKQSESAADIGYLEKNAPAAFARALDGIARISTIVGAMKEFAHPDRREKSPADLNRAIQTTLTIAKNEYKYVADIETDFGELPKVMCHVGDLNQVFLNLIVNAAHAIADVVAPSGGRGRIRIRTLQRGEHVRIDIADTGCGIPESIRRRIFEPFFTTKEVGRGSGQGLAIARSIVVEKHGGSLTFESEVHKGTTFSIQLPVDGQTADPETLSSSKEMTP